MSYLATSFLLRHFLNHPLPHPSCTDKKIMLAIISSSNKKVLYYSILKVPLFHSEVICKDYEFRLSVVSKTTYFRSQNILVVGLRFDWNSLFSTQRSSICWLRDFADCRQYPNLKIIVRLSSLNGVFKYAFTPMLVMLFK